jgi:hypothetical protein
VRRICSHCKVEKEKTPGDIRVIEAMMQEIGMPTLSAQNMKLYEAT